MLACALCACFICPTPTPEQVEAGRHADNSPLLLLLLIPALAMAMLLYDWWRTGR